MSDHKLVCYTGVFSVVTERSSPGTLRDDNKNGCVALTNHKSESFCLYPVNRSFSLDPVYTTTQSRNSNREKIRIPPATYNFPLLVSEKVPAGRGVLPTMVQTRGLPRKGYLF